MPPDTDKTVIALQQAVLAGLLLAVFFLAVHARLAQLQPVDLLLDNGHVITMDDIFSIRTAAVKDGLIVARWRCYCGSVTRSKPHGRRPGRLTDPAWREDQRPRVVGRKRFGRITIANTDSAATAYTDAAIDQAYRAVNELTET